jgi:inorganic pyrophosphatase
VDATSITFTPLRAWVCTCMGLWSGCLIGFITEYYTSHSYKPVREVSQACETGAATNIIYGLALGYKSAVLPVSLLSIVVYVSFYLGDMYGVSLAALGMLSNLSTCLAIDVYGPICDNAGGIAEMAELPEHVRDVTDALDAAGNTTAAIGKGFAIGSACLVGIALFGAFITRSQLTMTKVSLLEPMIFASVIFGAMIPYWFSAMTMKSVGQAANEMVKEVARQFREIPGLLEGTPGHAPPDHAKCIEISTDASLREMIAPAVLVMTTPLAFGILLGNAPVAGMLAGAIVSSIQMAISSSNTGGAWDNAKKYVEKGSVSIDGVVQGKGSELHKAAVVGDTVGDPLKDTSGPALNIVMKLMAILSLVFADFFLSINNGKGLLMLPH